MTGTDVAVYGTTPEERDEDFRHPVGPHEHRDAVGMWELTRVQFVRYDAVTGEIHGGGVMGYAFIEAEHQETRAILPGAGSPETHYVDVATQTIREKAKCPARIEGRTLHDLPMPCRIEISQFGAAPVVYDWTDADCTLAFDHLGYWTVRVLAPTYLAASFGVTVDA